MKIQNTCDQLDAETWQCQLEELLALQSVYDEDFRLLAAPGLSQAQQTAHTSYGGFGEQQPKQPLAEWACLDLEELLLAGPPSELLLLNPGGGGSGGGEVGSSGSSGSLGCFVAEALVHVDVPEGGLQLILEVQMPPRTAPSHLLTPLRQPAAPSSGAGGCSGLAAAGDSGSSTPNDANDDPGPQIVQNIHGRQLEGTGWATVPVKRNGHGFGRGGGRGRSRGRGAGPGFNDADIADDGSGGCGRGEVVSSRGQVNCRRGSRNRSRADNSTPNVPISSGSGPIGVVNDGSASGGCGNGKDLGSHPRGRSKQGRDCGAQHATSLHSSNSCVTLALGSSDTPKVASREESDVGCTSAKAAVEEVAGVAMNSVGEAQAAHGLCSRVAQSMREPDEDLVKPSSARWQGPLAAEIATAGQSGLGTGPQGEEPGPVLAPGRVPFGASVQFLSPIRVTLTLPTSYPASAPPRVELQSLWLTAMQTQKLVSELQEQWRANGGAGTPTLFLWLHWLRSEALSHLGIKQELILNTAASAMASMELGAAAAAVVGGPEVLAISLMRYSARRELEKFNESNIRCPICMDEHLGQRCMRLPECHDTFCTACLATHVRTQLSCGAVDNMRCPAPSCRRQLPPYVLQELMTQAEYERWETLTLQRTLDKMEDLVYCPRCREPCLEDKDHCTLCPGCFFSFCALCEESWHPGSSCLDPESRLALLEQRRVAGSQAGGLSATERARQELNRLNELKSLALLANTTKQCPLCSMGVEKTEGCNKMTCSYCGGFFCWRCNQVIRGYDHFQQSDGEGGCVLFEQHEIDRWNARWNAGPRVVEVEQRGAMVGWMRQNAREARICRCVVCGQGNVKEGGNNDIRCWSCNSHFCYLCRTWLRTKPGAHFGPGRCRQHSDD